MKPYSPSSKAAGSTKGLVSGRKSKATPHRKRCLKRDKAAARREGRGVIISDIVPGIPVSCPTYGVDANGKAMTRRQRLVQIDREAREVGPSEEAGERTYNTLE